METCSNTSLCFCSLFYQIDWIWYIAALILVFGVGALWYSVFFPKAWMRVFKVEMGDKISKSNMIFTMFLQFISSAILGLALFMITSVSVWLALFALVSFVAWQKAGLKFRYSNSLKDFFMASLIEAGHTFIAGLIYILFALF